MMYAGFAFGVLVFVAGIVLGQCLCGVYLSCFKGVKKIKNVKPKVLKFDEMCQVSPMDLGEAQEASTQVDPRTMWNMNMGYKFQNKNQK